MKRKTSIHYLLTHMEIRNLVFEEWTKFNKLLSEGPKALKEYFCFLWNKQKEIFEARYDLEVIDIEKEINEENFGVSYSVLDKELKSFNFTMPEPLTDYGQAVCVSVILTSGIPRYFTLEYSKNANGEICYVVGEWQIDFENNDYMHKNYGTIKSGNIGEFLGKINEILNERF